jgi:cytochrome c553
MATPARSRHANAFLRPARTFVIALASALATLSCANLPRSRDLGNPAVAPQVTARQVCSNCHAVDGVSISPNFPRLAGQQKDYLVAQLRNFRSHQRSDPAGYEYMWGITRKLSDATIDGLADYFSAQAPRPNAPVDAALLPLGRQIFEEGVPDKAPPCFACHGAHGEGLASFPRLAGQHSDYLVKQLHIFQETEQRPGTPMKEVAHQLTKAQIVAVSAFLQAFPDSPATDTPAKE